LIKLDNSDAKSKFQDNDKLDIAVIESSTWPKDRTFCEFNVVRIQRIHDEGSWPIRMRSEPTKTTRLSFCAASRMRGNVDKQMVEHGLKINTAASQAKLDHK
jgi:hypothetical protein